MSDGTNQKPLFRTGAIVGISAPTLKEPLYDIELRDRLYSELSSLRAKSVQSSDDAARIDWLVQTLNDLLAKG